MLYGYDLSVSLAFSFKCVHLQTATGLSSPDLPNRFRERLLHSAGKLVQDLRLQPLLTPTAAIVIYSSHFTLISSCMAWVAACGHLRPPSLPPPQTATEGGGFHRRSHLTAFPEVREGLLESESVTSDHLQCLQTTN